MKSGDGRPRTIGQGLRTLAMKRVVGIAGAGFGLDAMADSIDLFLVEEPVERR